MKPPPHTLPEGYTPHPQWPEVRLDAPIPAIFRPREVGQRPRGAAWGIWPLYFASFISDEEPDLSSLPRGRWPRFVCWVRIARTDRPRGWYQLSLRPKDITGVVELGPDYASRWTKSARYYRRQWRERLLHKVYNVEPLSLAEFAAGYKRSTIYKKMGGDRLEELERQVAASGAHIQLWGARRAADGLLVAGIAVLESPSCKAAYYNTAFLCEEGKKDQVMTGLLDYWHEDALRRGFLFLDLGQFWQKGQPRGWRGFSDFKAQFGPRFVRQQAPLWRVWW